MRLSTAAALCGGVMRRPARLKCSILCAQVLSVKEQSDGRKMYYVHWSDFNRRLDTWVKPEDVDYTATKDKIKEIKARKANFDKFTHEGHDDHDGLDEASLKEHEEVTKIKNVHKIQMGKFIVETWYFSPLPREIWKQGHRSRLDSRGGSRGRVRGDFLCGDGGGRGQRCSRVLPAPLGGRSSG